MRKRLLHDYVQLGTCIRFLIDLDVGDKILGYGKIRENVDQVFRLLRSLEMPVSSRLASSFELEAIRRRFREAARDDVLNEDDRESLSSGASQLRNTVIAEASGLYAYTTTEKRFDAEKLIESPGELFSPGVFDRFSEIARFDVAEGFKCIAFERPTAAAFHMMRAVEDSVKCFYLTVVKRGRVKRLMWGDMVEHLRRRSKPPEETLLTQLDYIRKNFRNPTQHPDATYTVDEVQDLALIVIDIMSRLARETAAAEAGRERRQS